MFKVRCKETGKIYKCIHVSYEGVSMINEAYGKYVIYDKEAETHRVVEMNDYEPVDDSYYINGM